MCREVVEPVKEQLRRRRPQPLDGEQKESDSGSVWWCFGGCCSGRGASLEPARATSPRGGDSGGVGVSEAAALKSPGSLGGGGSGCRAQGGLPTTPEDGAPGLLGRLLCCRRCRGPSTGQAAAGAAGKASASRVPVAAREYEAIRAFEAELGPSGMASVAEALVPGETAESCLLRFLRARDLSTERAMAMLLKDLHWRREMGLEAFVGKTRGDIAGCKEEVLQNYLPSWHQGFDKEGRPVIFKHYGKLRLPVLLKHTTVEALERLHVFDSDRAARLCGQQTQRLGRDITKVVYVVDAEGWDANQLRMPSGFIYCKAMAVVDQDHYPERLSRIMVINAPYVVVLFWSLLKHAVERNTQDKIQIFGGRRQWEPVLLNMMDASQLPEEYGGCAPVRDE